MSEIINRNEIVNLLKIAVSNVTAIPSENLKADVPLENYGINSTMIVELNLALEQYLPGLPSTVFFEYETLDLLAEYVAKEHFEILSKGICSRQSNEIVIPATPCALVGSISTRGIKDDSSSILTPKYASDSSEKLDTSIGDWRSDSNWSDEWLQQFASKRVRGHQDIAIIGMSGKYAESDNLDEFWQNLLDERDCISDVPRERWDVSSWFDADKERTDRVYSRWGGFVRNHNHFDARYFNISPREAKRMDPQERLFLQIAIQTLEHAGYSNKALRNSKTGVFVGAMWSLYQLYGAESTAVGVPDIASSSFASIANRLSWFLDLKGPSFSVDSMCSSSLTALHVACQAICNDECEKAIVGGVNITSHPAKYQHLCTGGFAATDGRCRAFGEGGTGYVPGEGVGAVLLKPLSKALEDDDQILSVIKATAINHGGHTHGYTVPSPAGQSSCISDALAKSGLVADDIKYVEAHGTGTSLGDPIEVKGLMDVYGDRKYPLRVGSVKSNIGHAESAAGMAGLHKLVLQFQHRTLVPSLHTENLNQHISWADSKIQVQRRVEEFDFGSEDAVGLSAFGAGGGNSHLILAPPPPALIKDKYKFDISHYPILVSAQSLEALQKQIDQLKSWIVNQSGELSISRICGTLLSGRNSYQYRTMFYCKDIGQLKAVLESTIVAESGELFEATRGSFEKSAYRDSLLTWLNGGVLDDQEVHSHYQAQKIGLPGYCFDEREYRLSEPSPPQGLLRISQSSTVTDSNEDCELWKGVWRSVESDVDFDDVFTPDQIIVDKGQRAFGEQIAILLGCSVDTIQFDVKASANKSNIDKLRILDLRDSISMDTLRGLLLMKHSIDYLRLHLKSNEVDRFNAELVRLLPAEYARFNAASVAISELSGQCVKNLWKSFSNGSMRPGASYEFDGNGLSSLEFEPVNRVTERVDIDPEATHIVTGGTGGIGFAMAKYLCDRGAKHLVLTGRREWPKQNEWRTYLASKNSEVGTKERVKELLTLPADIEIVTWDLTDKELIAEELSSLAEVRPIGTVIHLAGSVDTDTPAFIDKTDEKIATVYEGKVDGAENILNGLKLHGAHRVLLVSSQCAVMPHLASGVMDYAAANAVLTRFADEHRSLQQDVLNFPVQTLMLPSWSGAGFGETQSPHYSRLGLRAVTEHEGLDLLDSCLKSQSGLLLAIATADEFKAKSAFVVQHPKKYRKNSTSSDHVSTAKPNRGEVVCMLANELGPILEIEPSDWRGDEHFSELGVDSVLLTRIANHLERWLSISIAADILLTNTSLSLLADWLLDNHSSNVLPLINQCSPDIAILEADSNAYAAVDVVSANEGCISTTIEHRPVAKIQLPSQSEENGIAIVGMSTLVPGAETLTEFWSNLTQSVDSVGSIPTGRWAVDNIDLPKGTRSKADSHGGFIDRLEYFDAGQFGLPPEMSEQTDPLVRVALWSTSAALADAGLKPSDLSGVEAGVFFGSRSSNWSDRISEYEKYSVLGTAQNFTAAHISHWLNISGPSLVVDTACSSSAYAVHLACKSLLDGECQVAIAGGSEILLDEKPYQLLGRTGALSPTGRCKTFDANADGFVPGEGGVVMVLKKVQQALVDGDRIYAVIESSATNNDGRTMGVTTPNPEAQKAVVRKALKSASIDPSDIGMIEAHGTGTELGDPMELKSLSEVFNDGSSEQQYCGVGSVKSSIGHLLCSAGAASIVKSALCIHHKQLVASLHCNEPNPRFQFSESPFYPVKENKIFEARKGIRRAGVNSFGFGGTNIHIQLSDRHLQLNYSPVCTALPIANRAGSYAWLIAENKNKSDELELVHDDGFQLLSNN